ncbi:hypothetical protein BC833DRAFT_222657 [Globomyces pollinis-pini]|nr:hypothetical protein BC833DRAFT_222657 [Globomyces pollinis-pini]
MTMDYKDRYLQLLQEKLSLMQKLSNHQKQIKDFEVTLNNATEQLKSQMDTIKVQQATISSFETVQNQWKLKLESYETLLNEKELELQNIKSGKSHIFQSPTSNQGNSQSSLGFALADVMEIPPYLKSSDKPKPSNEPRRKSPFKVDLTIKKQNVYRSPLKEPQVSASTSNTKEKAPPFSPLKSVVPVKKKPATLSPSEFDKMFNSKIPWPQIIRKSHPGSLSQLLTHHRKAISDAVYQFLRENLGSQAHRFIEQVHGNMQYAIPEAIIPDFLEWFDVQLDNGLTTNNWVILI